MSERTPEEILDELGRDLLAARPHRGRVQGGVLALAVLAIVAALSFTDAPPDREVAVTPTPTAKPSVEVAAARADRGPPGEGEGPARDAGGDLDALAKRKWVARRRSAAARAR